MTGPQIGNRGEAKDRTAVLPVTLEVKGLQFRYPSHKISSKKWGFSLRNEKNNEKDADGRGVTSAEFPLEKAGFQIGPLDLDIRQGEVLSICGPNGSGKTTLLGLLGGWLTPHAGRVVLAPSQKEPAGEVSLLPARERARRIALVRQESPLLFPMTVAQFVLLGRYAYLGSMGFESPDDWEVARASMRMLSLLDLAEERMDRISGGEKQRAILARALVQQPELLLLDEPTANLDISFQLEFLQLVRNLTNSLNSSGGLSPHRTPAVVAVLHDLNLASQFSGSVLLLAKGKPLHLGSPEEVFTPSLLEQTYGVPMLVDRNPANGKPRISFAAKL